MSELPYYTYEEILREFVLRLTNLPSTRFSNINEYENSVILTIPYLTRPNTDWFKDTNEHWTVVELHIEGVPIFYGINDKYLANATTTTTYNAIKKVIIDIVDHVNSIADYDSLRAIEGSKNYEVYHEWLEALCWLVELLDDIDYNIANSVERILY